MSQSQVTMRDMLEAGVHFGHQTRRWNPKMKPYIFGKRNGIYIIDLQKTAGLLDEALDYVKALANGGRRILFVGTKRQAQDVVAQEATRCGQFYVTHRWLGGMLTNFVTIRNSIDRLQEIEERLADEESPLTKKEIIRLEREHAKINRNLVGIRGMTRLPDAIFVVDPKREHIAISEANKLDIPVIAIVDTNCDPEEVDFVIPGNDDAIRTIRLFTGAAADAYIDGAMALEQAIEQAEKDAPAEEEEGAPVAAAETAESETATVEAEPSAEAEAPAEPEAAAESDAAPEPEAAAEPEAPAEAEAAPAEVAEEPIGEVASSAVEESTPVDVPAEAPEPIAEPDDAAADDSGEELPN